MWRGGQRVTLWLDCGIATKIRRSAVLIIVLPTVLCKCTENLGGVVLSACVAQRIAFFVLRDQVEKLTSLDYFLVAEAVTVVEGRQFFPLTLAYGRALRNVSLALDWH